MGIPISAPKLPQESNAERLREMQTYMLGRVRVLLRQHYSEIENAWKAAWIAVHLLPHWYINTNSIPTAALKDMVTSLVDSVQVQVQEGKRIAVMGTIFFNPDAVLEAHNQMRSGMTPDQEKAIRFKGANPRALGITGSFSQIKHPFLAAFLSAGPNVSAGAAYVRGSGTNLGANVFRALGQKHYGVPIITRRAGPVNGDVLMEAFSYKLGFSQAATRLGKVSWQVRGSLRDRQKGVVKDILTVVMQEVRTQFPDIEFEQ